MIKADDLFKDGIHILINEGGLMVHQNQTKMCWIDHKSTMTRPNFMGGGGGESLHKISGITGYTYHLIMGRLLKGTLWLQIRPYCNII